MALTGSTEIPSVISPIPLSCAAKNLMEEYLSVGSQGVGDWWAGVQRTAK